MIYNIYCDESCHLQNDHQKIMTLGCVWSKKDSIKEVSNKLKALKETHDAKGELKWTKVSFSRRNYYVELVKYFLRENNLHYRGLIVSDKSLLNHELYNFGEHDLFYYKMFFSLLRPILDPINKYNIYLDIKDTKSSEKIQKLKEVLCNNQYDFTREMIQNIQNIRSHESEMIQLADFLTGMISYKNRNLHSNKTKKSIIELIESEGSYDLTHSSTLLEQKINIFVFNPKKNDN